MIALVVERFPEPAVAERRKGRPKSPRPLKPFSLRLDDELLAAACREAKRQSTNPQVLIRVALQRFLAQPEERRRVRAER